MHLIVIEIIVGVEYFRDGVIDTGQDLFFVSSHALHAFLGHEYWGEIFETMKNLTSKAYCTVHHLKCYIETWSVFFLETMLRHFKRALSTCPAAPTSDEKRGPNRTPIRAH